MWFAPGASLASGKLKKPWLCGPALFRRLIGTLSSLHPIRHRGEALGIDFDFDSDCLIANTLDAHRLIRWAGPAGCQDFVVETLMSQYFEEAAFLGDKALLCDIAENAGMDRELVTELLSTDRDADLVRQDIQQANNMGVSGVPFFIFDGKSAVSGAQSSEVFVQIFGQLSGEVQIVE